MRLWIRLLVVLAAVALLPLLVAGWLAVGAARDAARIRPEEAMSREASTLATFAGSWIDAQVDMLVGWHRVWDVRGKGEDYQVGLARAVYKAMDGAVTVALVDAEGRPIVPPQYLTASLAGSRRPGTAARADALLRNLPTRVTAEGVALGVPYAAPGEGDRVVPVVAATTDASLRLVAELSLQPLVDVFSDRGQSASILVDGRGTPIVGGDHPYLADAELGRLLDLGLDLTFTAEGSGTPYQGAIWAVPGTDWKVVVLAPPDVGEAAAATIAAQTWRVALLALVAVVLVGVVLDRTLTRSVRALHAHAEALAAGDLEHRNRVDRADEIGDLGLALNEMATRRELDQAEILAFHRDLQARVDARTAELRAAQDQLVRAGQVAAVGEVSAGLAHELANPIAAILGTVQLLRSGVAIDDDAALARVETQAGRCRELVDTMQRLGGGGPAPVAGSVELRSIVAACVEAALPVYAARKVRLSLAAEGGDPVHARLEPAVARRLVSDLLGAIAAGLGEGASVTVDVLADGDPTLVVRPDRPVAEGGAIDDWRAAGLKSWSVRGLVGLAGGEVVPGTADDPSWRVRFPAAG